MPPDNGASAGASSYNGTVCTTLKMAQFEWNVEREEKHIDWWQERPCLYDSSSTAYGNREQKVKTWDEMTIGLERPVTQDSARKWQRFLSLPLGVRASTYHRPESRRDVYDPLRRCRRRILLPTICQIVANKLSRRDVQNQSCSATRYRLRGTDVAPPSGVGCYLHRRVGSVVAVTTSATILQRSCSGRLVVGIDLFSLPPFPPHRLFQYVESVDVIKHVVDLVNGGRQAVPGAECRRGGPRADGESGSSSLSQRAATANRRGLADNAINDANGLGTGSHPTSSSSGRVTAQARAMTGVSLRSKTESGRRQVPRPAEITSVGICEARP
ncbi:hypothetical protein LSAT2_028879 [Lamellibrachia satsuma]|nr:hypothetical protein LSAT2_028879 [Lamellibrachia satsuma]